jgi:hypothetical protein
MAKRMMPSRYVLRAVLLFSVAFCCPGLRADEVPDGFRGIKWGAAVSSVQGMTLLETQGEMRAYSRVGDKMSIGRAELTAVFYYFYKDRFNAVYVETLGPDNYEGLKETLVQAYGEPAKPNHYMEKYRWTLGNDEVEIRLEYNTYTTVGSLFYSYQAISRQIEEDNKRKARLGVQDL